MMRQAGRQHAHCVLEAGRRSPSIASKSGRHGQRCKGAKIEGVLSGLTVIAVVVCLGYVVGRLDVIGPGAENVLSRLTFSVATPALLFSTLARADVRSVLSAALLVTVVSSVSAVVLFVLVAGALWRGRWPRPSSGRWPRPM